jgi:hypothetical protein
MLWSLCASLHEVSLLKLNPNNFKFKEEMISRKIRNMLKHGRKTMTAA